MQPGAKNVEMPDVFTVRKPFNMPTRSSKGVYKKGDKFDWKAAGIAKRRARQLWDQRWIGTQEEFDLDRTRFKSKQDAVEAAERSMAKRREKQAAMQAAAPVEPQVDSPEADISADVETVEGATAEDLGL